MHNWIVTATLTTSLAGLGALAAVDPAQLQQHLTAGVGILGNYTTEGRLTDWMAVLDDSAPLVSLNLPGTHDSAAWNPSGLTRPLLQTQDKPIFDQLNAGIRFFDIRTGSNNGKLQFYHADLLLDNTAQLEDLFWGFYHFLDDHPTETLVISVKVDHGPTDAAVQQLLQAAFTGSPASNYWILDATLGTLGNARGKAVLFRRFTFDGNAALGLDMTQWKDNNADFPVPYAADASASVEDLYQLDLGSVPADTVVQTKLQAVQTHITSAAAPANASEFFVTFASGGGQISSQYVTPRILAEGSTSTNPTSATKGVNALTLPWLQQQAQGARFGVVLYDYYESPTDLVLATIANSKVTPNATADPQPTSPPSVPDSQQSDITGAASAHMHISAFLLLGAVLSASI